MNAFERLNSWKEDADPFKAGMSAQAYLSRSTGGSCGAGDKEEPKPTACGTSCGAGDKEEPKPTV